MAVLSFHENKTIKKSLAKGISRIKGQPVEELFRGFVFITIPLFAINF